MSFDNVEVSNKDKSVDFQMVTSDQAVNSCFILYYFFSQIISFS